MNPLRDIYGANPGLWNFIIAILIFGGLARIAFWRDGEGLKVGGPLAVGLALLLTVGFLTWAGENGRRIQEYGPWAAFLVAEAILLLGLNAWRKSRQH